jgi:hypothetical protein
MELICPPRGEKKVKNNFLPKQTTLTAHEQDHRKASTTRTKHFNIKVEDDECDWNRPLHIKVCKE